MSVMTVALLVLLVVRHRKNFARICGGDRAESLAPEETRRSRPAGRIAVVVAGRAGGRRRGRGRRRVASRRRSARREVLAVGRCTLAEVAREGTGHQRAERVAFADGGRLLAVTCPRYDRLVLYRVTDRDTLELLDDIGARRQARRRLPGGRPPLRPATPARRQPPRRARLVGDVRLPRRKRRRQGRRRLLPRRHGPLARRPARLRPDLGPGRGGRAEARARARRLRDRRRSVARSRSAGSRSTARATTRRGSPSRRRAVARR